LRGPSMSDLASPFLVTRPEGGKSDHQCTPNHPLLWTGSTASTLTPEPSPFCFHLARGLSPSATHGPGPLTVPAPRSAARDLRGKRRTGLQYSCLDATQPYDPRPAYFMLETVDVIVTRQTLVDSRDPDCTWPNGPRPAACARNGGRGPDALAGHNRMISGRQIFMRETADVIVTCQSLTDSRNLVWS